MICKKCNNSIPDAAKFCPKCGAKIEIPAAQDIQTKKCPSCGAENPASAKFCKVDGYNFQQAEKKREERPTEVEKPSNLLFCPKCGASYPLTAKFCKKDGTSLQQVTGTVEIRKPDTKEGEIKPDATIESKAEAAITETKAVEEPPEKVPVPEKPKDFIVCPKCGTTNPLTAKFCKKDGAPLKEDIKPSLVREIQPEVPVKPAIKESGPPKAESRKKAIRKTSKIWVWITICGVVLIILCGGSYLYFSDLIGKKPESLQKKINMELEEKKLDSISVQVDKEWVATVSGIVGKPIYRSEALNIVKSHKEVKEIIDNIQTTGDMEKKINNALKDEGINEIYANMDDNLITTLKGFASSEGEKAKAVNIARGFKELKDLKDEIQIKTPSEIVKDNTARIEEEMNQKFRKRGLKNIYAQVGEDLVATLSGTAKSNDDKTLAINIAKSYRELRGLTDNIRVAPEAPEIPAPPAPAATAAPPQVDIAKLQEEINMALKKRGLSNVYAEIDRDLIATLNGFVNNKVEESDAINITRSYGQLRAVRTRIEIKMQPKALEAEIRKVLINAGITKVAVIVSEDFEVTLKGVVFTRSQRDEALRIARSFKGVKGVRDNFIFVVIPWK
jgi:osmotically-inducible protein OsmY